jgi:putative restriction endonuclease
MKGVFDTRPHSGYDDEASFLYHFPNNYLPVAMQLVGDWVVFREPRREGGRQAYVAAALVTHLSPDPSDQTHTYAFVDYYTTFDGLVQLRRADGRYYEDRLNGVPSHLVGRTLQGHSVRGITEIEFDAIVASGLAKTLAPANPIRVGLTDPIVDLNGYELVAPPGEQPRRMAQVLMNRKVRDAAFRLKVLAAYDDTCAVTGTRIVNGGGRAEAQAAHIWAVQDGGPDLVQNGLALSATVHWLFDRHLISLTDDCRLLVADNRVPANLRVLFCGHLEMIRLPRDPALRPHPKYIASHRERFVGPR